MSNIEKQEEKNLLKYVHKKKYEKPNKGRKLEVKPK